MLELRPNCEACDRDLPADSDEACMCSYECTFCSECVETLLKNVCPNCGGGFVARPIRPKVPHRAGVSLASQPASTRRVNTRYSRAEMTEFAESLCSTSPGSR